MSEVTKYFEQAISRWLDKEKANDELFADQVKASGKTVEGCCNYIIQRVRESKQCGYSDDEIYGMARHFFDEDSEYLPRTYTSKNCIAYPASHDSDCTRSWYASLDAPTRARFRRETSGLISSSAAYRLIELSHSSIAKLSVIPMQDYLLLGSEARLNVPGVAEGNWRWQMEEEAFDEKLAATIREVTARYRR
jgi:4-alpha-glucanotransferase